VPFTVSHIAAVIPGHRWLSRAHLFSAAVIGSMVPDFGLLWPWGAPARWETHSLTGLFTFCVPVGLISYLLTQLLIRPALVEVLPDGPYARLRASQPSTSLIQGPSWIAVVGALLVGALTHLVWDNFTHENSHAFRAIPMLGYGADFFGHPLAMYRWLQLVSSLVGLALVIAALVLWLHHAPKPPEPVPRNLAAGERTSWIILYLSPPVLIVSWAVWRISHWGLPLASNWVLGSVAVLWLRGVALSLLLISALLRLRLIKT
jgi:hypothetical protein